MHATFQNLLLGWQSFLIEVEMFCNVSLYENSLLPNNADSCITIFKIQIGTLRYLYLTYYEFSHNLQILFGNKL